MALYEFGLFVLDAPERRLTRQGERVPVTGKTLDVLRLLLEAQGRLVDRQTFNAQLWPEVVVAAGSTRIAEVTLLTSSGECRH